MAIALQYPPLKTIDQTIFHDKVLQTKGNCMQAAVATLLDLPLDGVENFIEHGDRCHHRLKEWLHERGFALERRDGAVVCAGYYLAVGKSPRGASHMVVMCDDQIAHDPHPQRTGILEVEFVYTVRPYRISMMPTNVNISGLCLRPVK